QPERDDGEHDAQQGGVVALEARVVGACGGGGRVHHSSPISQGDAATTIASVPRSSVGWMSGAKNGEWLPGAFFQSLKPPRPQEVYAQPKASGITEKSSDAGTGAMPTASSPT